MEFVLHLANGSTLKVNKLIFDQLFEAFGNPAMLHRPFMHEAGKWVVPAHVVTISAIE
jgi:hypothetical protein